MFRNAGSVGFIVHTFVVHLIDYYKILLPFLTILHLRLQRQKPISIISWYSPTSAADETELDAFYEQLNSKCVLVIRSKKSLYKFLFGDLNAKIGAALKHGNRRIGKCGCGERNEMGNRLVGLLSTAPLTSPAGI